MRIDESFTAATDLGEAIDSLREACAILYATKLPSDTVWSDYADPTPVYTVGERWKPVMLDMASDSICDIGFALSKNPLYGAYDELTYVRSALCKAGCARWHMGEIGAKQMSKEQNVKLDRCLKDAILCLKAVLEELRDYDV